MIPLAVIIASLLMIHLCGGGLIIESLFISSLALNITAVYQFYINHREKRLCYLPLAIGSALLLISIGLFFCPIFPINETSATYYYSAKNLLIEGSQFAFFSPPESTFTNTLHLDNSLSIFILIINLFPLVYLCANLKHRHKLYLIYAVVTMVLINVIAVLYQQQIRNTGGFIWWIWDSQTGKSFGSFVNPNHFGAYCAAMLSIPVCYFFKSLKTKEYKYLPLSLIVSSLLILGIMLSGSMGAYLLGIIALVISYLLTLNRKNSGPVKTFFILFIVLIFSTLTPLQLEDEINTRGLKDDLRQKLFATVPTVAKDFPVGMGPGAYRSISPSYTGSINDSGVFHHSENTYFQIIQEFGIPFFLVLIFLNGIYLNKIIDNVRKKKLSKYIASFCSTGLIVFICHASYDYGFHIPIYAFHIAIFYGLMLCKGQTYKENYHSKQELYLSKCFFLTPSLLICITLYIWTHFGDELKNRNTVIESAYLTTDDLSIRISKSPAVWHQWYFLGLKVLQEEPEDFFRMDFAEKCFQKAAHYAPINKDCWYMLFMIRDQLGRDDEAQKAYGFYYKLLTDNEKSQHKSEAMDVLQLTAEEYEKIRSLEHAPIDFEISTVREI